VDDGLECTEGGRALSRILREHEDVRDLPRLQCAQIGVSQRRGSVAGGHHEELIRWDSGRLHCREFGMHRGAVQCERIARVSRERYGDPLLVDTAQVGGHDLSAHDLPFAASRDHLGRDSFVGHEVLELGCHTQLLCSPLVHAILDRHGDLPVESLGAGERWFRARRVMPPGNVVNVRPERG
jgi:hypothetical protein